ncbi:MAG: hypothetical protein M1834_006926 [Cirrosporium novae-zelandiae]|nr:MAG: hypothetical protein M1834_006926 [Cirrosporium novae-zelandiae]
MPGNSEVTETHSHLSRDFGILGLVSVAWNVINIFGGLSYIFVVGFSAGGLPSIFYGFIGATCCVVCLIATLAECAAMFPTAGIVTTQEASCGAYHFATFLAPPKYRRLVGYPMGWFNFLGWVLTEAACCAIFSGLVYSMAVLCNPDFVQGGRWQLFLVYVAVAAIAWLCNLYMLKIIPYLENAGCWISLTAFLAFFVTLLALSKKADPASVFVDIVNETGYSSNAMAVVLGLYNSMAAWMCLDGACHLAEEVPNPTRNIPKILYLSIGVQFLVGVVWILAIGFSIENIDVVINSPTGVPIVELVRQATNSNGAAIVFNLVLLINYFAATVGSALTSSRQGFALARDGGLFFKRHLTRVDPKFKVPTYSVHFCFFLVVLVGIIYLLSTEGFNAILGAEVAFMILAYAAPAFIMLCIGRSTLPKTPFSLGKFLGHFCCIVTIVYSFAVLILVMIPMTHPVTAESMNYTILIFGISFIIMGISWFSDARTAYQPPSFKAFVEKVPIETEKGGLGIEGALEITQEKEQRSIDTSEIRM